MAFPELSLADWQRTRDTLHDYCRLLGGIRRALSARQRHWSHAALLVAAEGLTTSPMPAGDAVFELRLDLVRHRIQIVSSRGGVREVALTGQSSADVLAEMTSGISDLGLSVGLDLADDVDENPGEWDRAAIQRFWSALVQIDSGLKTFKGRLRRETSPVQLFPHHLDLALSWYSGRLIPDQDPADEDGAEEQMTFGFSTGDDTIADPYFYATAYPEPPRFAGPRLSNDAYWQKEGFSGAVLPYAPLVADRSAGQRLRSFLESAHLAGASRMT